MPLRLGAEPVVVTLTDLPAVAAQHPSVAADLKAAGLTAEQAMAYRTALETPTGAYLRAHPEEFKALEATGCFATP